MSSSIKPTGWRSIDCWRSATSRRQTVSPDELMRHRGEYAHGNGGVPIVGDPDYIARQLIDLEPRRTGRHRRVARELRRRAALFSRRGVAAIGAGRATASGVGAGPRLLEEKLQDTSGALYSILMPASRITLPHFSSSAFKEGGELRGRVADRREPDSSRASASRLAWRSAPPPCGAGVRRFPAACRPGRKCRSASRRSGRDSRPLPWSARQAGYRPACWR